MKKSILAQLKQSRLEIQQHLDNEKTQEDRNRLGQFATPPPLAEQILAYAKKQLSPDEKVRFLDPAIGTGSFYSALLKTFPNKRIVAATGFEIDPHYAAPAASLWGPTKLDLKETDFTRLNFPEPEERFNLLICNPPYVRHHHVTNGEKGRIQAKAMEACGLRIGGLAGLYCYFMGLSHAWLENNGLAGWLIPSEFMDVNYGRAVKKYLLDTVELFHIHRFDPNELQFDEALVSSCIVWFRKTPPNKDYKVRFTFGGTLLKPKLERYVSRSALRNEHKWTRFPVQNIRTVSSQLKLSDFFDIKRGLATGSNSYFILNPEQISANDLPQECFHPILPSPRYLDTQEIEADAQGNPLLEKRLFLLNCHLSEDKISKIYPSLARYLAEGKKQGVADRYLCKHRKPWYSQENRPAPLFVCTYLGRQNTRSGKPFRFIFNRSKATIANVYLALYLKPFLAEAIAKHPGLDRKIWHALNAIETGQILNEGRVYGGGLHKIEPKELSNVPIPELNAILPNESQIYYQTELLEAAE